MKVLVRGAILGALLVAGGCHLASRTAPHVELSQYHRIFVQHLLTDGRGVDQMIARELRHRGYDAIAGPLTMMPDKEDAIVVYQDQWNFDFTNYMIQIDLQVRKARTGDLLGTATYFKPSLMGRSPLSMIDAVLDKLFPVVGPPVPEPAPEPGVDSVSPST